ncbi:MAG: PIN domain-containing protein [Thermoplasmatota archaeon]
MDLKKYCFDASVLFIYVTEKDACTDLDRIISMIKDGRSEGIISTVNLAEFHRAIMRAFSESKADLYISWIRESGLSIVDLDEEIALLASLKKQHYAKARSPFAWGDAFCLATALKFKCETILTSDSEFDKIAEIEVLKI